MVVTKSLALMLAACAITPIVAAPPGVPAANVGALPHAGTTVQLPTFRFFGVGTTVSVPDRGVASLGGVSRSTTAHRSAGGPLLPGRNTGISSSASAGSIQITAWIHDLEAMDRALLEQAAAGRAVADIDPAQQAILARKASDTATPHSLAAIRARQAAADSAELSTARAHFAKGQSLAAEGKPGVAKIYFRMAFKHADDEMRAAIATQLSQLDGPRVAGD